MRTQIACQTIVYGNPVIKDTIETILENVKGNGYDGVEIGARHFYMDRPAFYAELLQRLNLALPALHIGGDFLNRDSVRQQLESIGKTIEFAKALGVPSMYLSGAYAKGKTRDDYRHEAKVYTQIGNLCNDAGLTLCYHNHDWEFRDNMTGMNILLDEVPRDAMRLVPDVGWVHMGGRDPVQFLSDNWDRVAALHFKDFKGPRQFTELGTGLVDFEAVWAFAAEKGKDMWITAEQDEYTGSPERSSLRNCRYIQWLIGA